MQGRLLFVAGAAVGYVLGARAGRRRYEQIKSSAERLWNDPKVQGTVDQVVDQVQGFVKEKAPEVQSAVKDTAKNVTSKVTRKGSKSSSGTTPSVTDTYTVPPVDDTYVPPTV